MSTEPGDKIIRFPLGHEADSDCGDQQPAGGFPPVVNEALSMVNAAVAGDASFIIIGITPVRDGAAARFEARMYGDMDILQHARDHAAGVIESMFQSGEKER